MTGPDAAGYTPGPWTTDGLQIWGPLDARSKHRNGRTLIGGVVDDLNDWRAWPSQSPDDRASFDAERKANAELIASAPSLAAENARLKAALGVLDDEARGYLLATLQAQDGDGPALIERGKRLQDALKASLALLDADAARAALEGSAGA